jgi:leader peptidase (prepilin peptidase) / N-methyltransferase
MPSVLPFEVAAFVVGLLLGSFLNVCISRIPEGESVVKPRSRCPHCGHAIAWYDNFPVVSWFLLRARCRHCGVGISWRYPAVEIVTGSWFLVAFLVTHRALLADFASSGPAQTAPILLNGIGISLAGFALIGLAVIDWQTHTLPDVFTLGGTVAGFVLTCVQAALLPTGAGDIHFTPRSSMRMQSPGSFAARGDVFLTGPEALVLERLFAIAAAAGLLILIRVAYKALRGHEGMGLGDVKLMGMMAAFLGFWDALLAFFVGMVTCAIYALYLLSRHRATAATKLPLGTFLAAGGLLTALAGEAILTWYKGLM